jgi:hypothetical protein
MTVLDDAAESARAPSWDDFHNVPERWTLPLYEFTYSLQYVPLSISPEQRTAALAHTVNCVVDALKVEPDCELTSLRVSVNKADAIEMGDNSEPPYFGIGFASPVFDFSCQLGPSVLEFQKTRTTLPNLLLTTRILTRVCQRLFPATDATAATAAANFEEHTSIALQPVRLTFSWAYQLALGARLSDGEETTNLGALNKLARLEVPAGSNPQEYPLAGLEMEGIQRGDVTIGFTKTLNDRKRMGWIRYEGPWNITRKDVDLRFSYQVGSTVAPMEAGDLGDFWTPFVAFYRDEILRKFMGQLFGDTAVTVRP